ncbi:hypothetical protein ONE63_004657 [Megalurothrips usitatus]|uniref:Proteophosphoglycan ppg4 n=1 Tax=Megalurothrips usitatus TaxID=439358 RepID=A0AAV7X704_9NEOP|nr:hypothetical protein ONE63_004657 [Megalurothrips usitatus]
MLRQGDLHVHVVQRPAPDIALLTPPVTPEDPDGSPTTTEAPVLVCNYHLTWLDAASHRAQDGSMDSTGDGDDSPHPYQGIIDYLLADGDGPPDAAVHADPLDVQALEASVWTPPADQRHAPDVAYARQDSASVFSPVHGLQDLHDLHVYSGSPSGRTSVHSLDTVFASPRQDFASPGASVDFASPVQDLAQDLPVFASPGSSATYQDGRASVQSLETVLTSASPGASAFPSPSATRSAFASPSPSASAAFASPSPGGLAVPSPASSEPCVPSVVAGARRPPALLQSVSDPGCPSAGRRRGAARGASDQDCDRKSKAKAGKRSKGSQPSVQSAEDEAGPAGSPGGSPGDSADEEDKADTEDAVDDSLPSAKPKCPKLSLFLKMLLVGHV